MQQEDGPFPVPGGLDVDLYVAVDKFRPIFAADVPAPEAAVMAASQRPIALSAGTEKSGPAAWKSIPSWALVAMADSAIGTSNVRFMAQRAGARIVEVDASHAVPVSHPDDVAALIVSAARSVS